MIDIDPLFTNSPEIVNGAIDISQTNFELTQDSPAIDAGDPNFSPLDDILGNPRPVIAHGISSTSFENSTGGWTAFGSNIITSDLNSKTGDQSLMITDRELNWHSAKLVLDNLLELGQSYTFYVWVKLAEGFSGTSQITIKNTSLNTYTSVTTNVAVSDQQWTLLSGDYTYSTPDNLFVYVKGPTMDDGGGDYFIDDFSLVPQGSSEVDFSNIGDIVDIGAYEYTETSLSTITQDIEVDNIFIYPNPAETKLSISKFQTNVTFSVFDLNGKQFDLPKHQNQQRIDLDISILDSGLYILRIYDKVTGSTTTLKFIKEKY